MFSLYTFSILLLPVICFAAPQIDHPAQNIPASESNATIGPIDSLGEEPFDQYCKQHYGAIFVDAGNGTEFASNLTEYSGIGKRADDSGLNGGELPFDGKICIPYTDCGVHFDIDGVLQSDCTYEVKVKFKVGPLGWTLGDTHGNFCKGDKLRTAIPTALDGYASLYKQDFQGYHRLRIEFCGRYRAASVFGKWHNYNVEKELAKWKIEPDTGAFTLSIDSGTNQTTTTPSTPPNEVEVYA